MDNSLLKSIENIGFTDKESKVILALFEIGTGPASSISKLTNLNRSTTYVTLENLHKKGYVTELPITPKRKVKQYSAVFPDKLFNVGKEHIENFKYILPVLRALHNRSARKPRIEFYDEKEAILNVWQQFSIADDARYVSSYGKLRTIFDGKIDKWIQSGISGKTRTKTKQIAHNDVAGRDFAKRIKKAKTWEVRFLPEQYSIDVDIAIVDDVIALTSFNPLFIVVVHSKSLAQSLSTVFDLGWEQCVRK